jgi:hypothetical protein
MTTRQKPFSRRSVLSLAAAAALLAVGVTGCASGRTAEPAASPSPPTLVSRIAEGPSDAAHLVCTDTAENEITGALGIDTTKPLVPTWKDHLYSCPYVFADGSLLLSVKDLASAAATTAWFDALRTAATGSTPLGGMGDGAFQEPDGSVVVRKDDAVLVVDVTALPANVGKPVRPRAVAARTVAQTVLICWKEY